MSSPTKVLYWYFVYYQVPQIGMVGTTDMASVNEPITRMEQIRKMETGIKEKQKLHDDVMISNFILLRTEEVPEPGAKSPA
jgi:hypothetical protein